MRPPPAAVRAVQRRHDCAGLPRLRLAVPQSDTCTVDDFCMGNRSLRQKATQQARRLDGHTARVLDARTEIKTAGRGRSVGWSRVVESAGPARR